MLPLKRRVPTEAALHDRRRAGDVGRRRRRDDVSTFLLGTNQISGRRNDRDSTIRKSFSL